MAAFLNSNELELVGIGLLPPRQLDELEKAELRAVAQAAPATTVPDHVQRDWDASDIEDFILNRARTAQVERIFASLGTRFKELAHDAR
jgi:hypothetical protein